MQEQGAGADQRVLGHATVQVVAGPGKAPEATTAPPRTGFRQAESAAGARSNGRLTKKERATVTTPTSDA